MGTGPRGTCARQAAQDAELRLPVDEDADIRRQLAGDGTRPFRAATGSVEVHAAGHSACLHHGALDRGVPDLVP
jgi:hypothetical protein